MNKLIKKCRKMLNRFVRLFQKQKPVYIPLVKEQYLQGRTALITGATSGIGYAIAEAYLRCGCNVVITGRKEAKIAAVVARLKRIQAQGYVKGFMLDISKADEIEASFQAILQKLNYDKVDILVNNAGVMDGAGIGNTSIEDFTKTIDTNLKGTFFLSQCVSDYMIQNAIEGNILNIVSSSALRPAISPYMLSKWGLRGLTAGMAKKLIPYGIVVNGIAPGPTLTPMLVKENEVFIDNANVPAGRFCTPEEIADLAVVLTSGMGRMIVGDVLYVTGGSGLLTYDDMKY